MSCAALRLARALLLLALTAGASAITVGWAVDPATGGYSLTVDSAPWYSSPSLAAAPPLLCVAGQLLPLSLAGPPAPATGTDEFGDWAGTAVTLRAAGAATATLVIHTFKAYAALPSVVVATAAFPSGVDAAGGGGGSACNGTVRTAFPQFNTSAAMAPALGVFSWRGEALDRLPSAVGLGALGQNTLDSGPVVSFFRGRPGVPHPALVWSTLSSHKIITQATTNGTYTMGLAAAVPTIPAGWEYSVVFSVADGGPTAAVYAWGNALRGYFGTTRLPSVTLTDIGYFSDDGVRSLHPAKRKRLVSLGAF